MAPKFVQTCKMQEDLLEKAAEQGLIELKRWKQADEPSQSLPCASRAWLLEHVKGATALACTPHLKIDKEVMDAAGPSLKVISTMSVGYEHIDMEETKKRGIRVGHTPHVLSNAVADLALALALNVTRHVMDSYHVVKAGRWSSAPWTPNSYCGPCLEGKVIGFIGFGGISQALVSKLLAFQPAKVLYKASKPRPFDLSNERFRFLAENPLLRAYEQCHKKLPFPIENQPDLLALARESDLILPTGYLVNVGRGPLIDTDALADALKQDKVAGAGLDVLEGEPHIPADHPLLDDALRDKVIVTSHIASATNESRHSMAMLTAQNALGAVNLRTDGPRDEMPTELR